MLGSWRNHKDYCAFVKSALLDISIANPLSIYEYQDQISKLFILNLDTLKDIISPLYSHTGRPSSFQPEIFRSFIMLISLKIPLDRWISKLKHNPVLQASIGVTSDNIPCVSSHYDFINRLINFDDQSRSKPWKRKPSTKLGKNKKLPNRHKNIVARLVDKILSDRTFSRRPEKILQSIFAKVAVALNEFKELYPNLKIDSFIHDAACDNYATYKLLDKWNIRAVIALNTTNKGNFSYPKALSIDKNGVPICPNGNQMLKWGFDKKRCRLKYRCTLACGKISSWENKANCSPSDYGRTIYVKPSWDLRLFTQIPRGSDLWIKKMKSRTSIELLNNRILNHYGVEGSKVRGKKRISFFTMLAGFNIHLDIQLRLLKSQGLFDFNQFFANPTAI